VAALDPKSAWKEGQEGIVKLPEDGPKVFALVAHWLYYQEVEKS
jgi:hypothetical protein